MKFYFLNKKFIKSQGKENNLYRLGFSQKIFGQILKIKFRKLKNILSLILFFLNPKNKNKLLKNHKKLDIRNKIISKKLFFIMIFSFFIFYLITYSNK